MKEFQLQKDSWHFKLATKFSIMNKYESDTTMCRYFWSVVLGGFVIALLSGLAICGLTFVGVLIYSWYLFFTTWEINGGVQVTIVIAIITSIIAACHYCHAYLSKRRRQKMA